MGGIYGASSLIVSRLTWLNTLKHRTYGRGHVGRWVTSRSFFRPSLFAPALTPSARFVNIRAILSFEKILPTGWIGDNSVKEVSASPWIICHIEGTEVYDPAVNAVLSGCASDSWSFVCAAVLQIVGGKNNQNCHLCLSFVGRQYQSRILVLQSVPLSERG